MKVLVDNNHISVECPHCKSSLGVFVEDIRYNEMAHHTSVFETDCGACGKPVGIKDPSIPPSWKHVIIPDD
jgi:endogenous inhibitor of DNA gyrase (YacG/DUF329 family)